MTKKIGFTIYLFLLTLALYAQLEVSKEYFLFPIKPGQTNYLTGSMGELRSNHFHAGIDVKTDFKIGLPVYCSADGYVSRIKVSSFGYGKVLYITHPNGLTTVYAHLDKFESPIAEWVLRKQYELESFDFDVLLAPTTILVKKGQVIAKSGNTGSSGGPHLHYEVRDKDEHVWNPLLFGFKEIKDNQAPAFEFLALRTFGIDARIEGEYGKKDFKPILSGKDYVLTKPIYALGDIGIEIKAHDRMNETHNHYGISCIDVKVNGQETFFHNINTFSFEDGKRINAHIDYETLTLRNQRFQRCYISDGNKLASYKRSDHNGRLFIKEGETYQIEINVHDAYNNHRTMRFSIVGKKFDMQITSDAAIKVGYRIFENILKLNATSKKDSICTVYLPNQIQKKLTPAYYLNTHPIYLYDLRAGLPDSIVTTSKTEYFSFAATIFPYREKKILFDDFFIEFTDTTLIDTLHLQLSCLKDPKGKHMISIHDPTTPLFGNIRIGFNSTEQNIHTKSYWALNARKYEHSYFDENKLLADTKYLGKFIIVKDTISPVVKYISHHTKSIKYSIFDTGSGIDKIRATLNGKWILMHYEHKNKTIWAEQLDKSIPIKGKFILEVTDKTGNITRVEKNL